MAEDQSVPYQVQPSTRLTNSGPFLSQCAAAEFEELLSSGQVAAAHSFLARHPELGRQKRFVLDLAYEEYCLDAEAGQPADPEEYCARFPAYKTSLRRLIALHSFLDRNQDLVKEQPVPWPKPGQPFLGFVLERELGRGAFARVFQAREPALGGRHVALKVSLRGGAEADTLGRLAHPHIVPVHSVQEDPNTGLTVVCMPYLGSATLEDVLDRVLAEQTPPQRARVILDASVDPVDQLEDAVDPTAPHPTLCKGTYVSGVIHLGVQLAEALAFIHTRGIYHRDLKPSNVLITPDGRPMLLDFNLSVRSQTNSETIVGGTLPYMAPEELLAADFNDTQSPRPFDPRSDLYSLGTILFELLTGIHPFGPIPLNATNEELRVLLLERQKEAPKPLRAANRGVDRALGGLLERCLAKDPDDRPQSAAELAGLLRRQLTWSRRTRRWLKVHPQVWPAAAAVLLVSSAAGAYWYSVREPYPLRMFHDGETAYRRGDYERAVQSFSEALKADPAMDDALFARGLAFQGLRQTELAINDYSRADKVSRNGRKLAYMGYFLGRHFNAHPEALFCYTRAVEAGFESSAVLNNVGYCYLTQNKAKEALQSLDKAVQLDPNLQAAYHNRALVALIRVPNQIVDRIPRQALADLAQAFALGPSSRELSMDAAFLYDVASRIDACWTERTFEYLQRAVQMGQNRTLLRTGQLSRHIGKDRRFKRLFDLPEVPTDHSLTARLVNPAPEYPD